MKNQSVEAEACSCRFCHCLYVCNPKVGTRTKALPQPMISLITWSCMERSNRELSRAWTSESLLQVAPTVARRVCLMYRFLQFALPSPLSCSLAAVIVASLVDCGRAASPDPPALSPGDREILRRYARDTWGSFE